jgi:hypothetical protein
MTSLGMTVITVIHQPRYSIFKLFDEVLLLGVGGKTVYQGPSSRGSVAVVSAWVDGVTDGLTD